MKSSTNFEEDESNLKETSDLIKTQHDYTTDMTQIVAVPGELSLTDKINEAVIKLALESK